LSVREAVRRGGIRLWFAALAGIGAWTVHLMALSSLVEWVCHERDWLWTLHALTVVTAGVTAWAMWLCLNTIRASDDDEAAATIAGSTRFVGVFGLLIGAISLALILLEGFYVLFLDPCV
jgi:hypothetical protein